MVNLSATDSIMKLATEHPDVIDIMVSLGFADIAKPGMLQTVGRFMTLAKGAKMKHIAWETVEAAFLAKGYMIQKEDLT